MNRFSPLTPRAAALVRSIDDQITLSLCQLPPEERIAAIVRLVRLIRADVGMTYLPLPHPDDAP